MERVSKGYFKINKVVLRHYVHVNVHSSHGTLLNSPRVNTPFFSEALAHLYFKFNIFYVFHGGRMGAEKS